MLQIPYLEGDIVLERQETFSRKYSLGFLASVPDQPVAGRS